MWAYASKYASESRDASEQRHLVVYVIVLSSFDQHPSSGEKKRRKTSIFREDGIYYLDS